MKDAFVILRVPIVSTLLMHQPIPAAPRRDLTEGESFYAFSQHIDNPETFIVLLIHQKSQDFQGLIN